MEYQLENLYANETRWLYAAALRAAEGVLFVTSIVLGLAAGNFDRSTIILAGLIGMNAGAMSVAVFKYVSISSEADTKRAYLLKEMQELEDLPDMKLRELAGIYEKRGVSTETALKVASELTHHNALAAHAQDELGITKVNYIKPLYAAFHSFGAFILGAILPIIISVFTPVKDLMYFQYVCSMALLIFFGAVSAIIGGAKIELVILRICFWGTIAIGTTVLVGYFLGSFILKIMIA